MNIILLSRWKALVLGKAGVQKEGPNIDILDWSEAAENCGNISGEDGGGGGVGGGPGVQG